MPLNVSREMLQEHKTLKVIRKKLIRKAIAMFQQMADEDPTKYKDFWKNYGMNLELGIIEDTNNRTRLSKLLMFLSSKTGELTSLSKYVERMKEGQEQIYYLAGESKENLEASPLIEKLLKKDFEVLYMVDAIDEYTLGNMEKFDGKYKLTNVAREKLKLDGEVEDKDKTKELEQNYEPLLNFLKRKLKGKIDRPEISNRLSSSPSALATGSMGWTPNMERIIKSQPLSSEAAKGSSQSRFLSPKKILEINVRHPIVKELNRLVEQNDEDPTATDIVFLLYETAALTSGWDIENPAVFAQRIVRMMNLGLSLDIDAVAEEEEPIQQQEPEEEPEVLEQEHHHKERDEL